MNIIKKILFRIGLLIVVLFVSNIIYIRFFYESDLQKYSKIINLVRDVPLNADIVYIGESSNITMRQDDLDKRKISTMISDYYPGLKIYDITKPAAHAGIYYQLLRNIPLKSKVKTIIVTLNLRSFNADWIYSGLETPLQKSIVLIKPYPPLYNRFLLSFKDYDIRTESENNALKNKMYKSDSFHNHASLPYKNVLEWKENKAKDAFYNKDGSINQELTNLSLSYIIAYAFQIDTLTNPRISDFNKIVRLGRRRGWNIVFNLLAENMQRAKELVGDELISFMDENRNLLIDYYNRKNVMVVDNLFGVENEQFIDQNWTTEHYAQKGRRFIARNVADSLKTFYKQDFVAYDLIMKSKTKFFNNCDTNLVWGQIETLTKEKAFSKTHSSVTGGGNDFGLSFIYPLNHIIDSCRNTVTYKCKINQSTYNQEAVIVFQAEGDSTQYYWKGVNISNQIDTINQWQNFEYTFEIPDSIQKADIIKLYLYNPTKDKVFTDDIKIEFK